MMIYVQRNNAINWQKMHSSWPKENSGLSSLPFLTLRFPPKRHSALILVSDALSGISSTCISTMSKPASFLYLYPFPGNIRPSFSNFKASFRSILYHRCIKRSRLRYHAVCSFLYLRFGSDSCVSTKNLFVRLLNLNPQRVNHSQIVDRDGVWDTLYSLFSASAQLS